MTNPLARVLRSATLLLALAALAIASTPASASADQPRARSAQLTAANRPRPKAASARRTGKRTARPTRASARTTRLNRAAARRRGGHSLRRARGRRHVSQRFLGPIVPSVSQASFVSDSADQLRDSIVSVARQQIGTAYVWGAETPGRAFDCSGLVKYVMSWLNVNLPRTANEQAYTGIRIGRDLDRLKPGDLITFGTGRRITHIGIYAGNSRYVHASRPGVGVVESLLNPSARRFRGAVRLVADADTVTTKSEPIP